MESDHKKYNAENNKTIQKKERKKSLSISVNSFAFSQHYPHKIERNGSTTRRCSVEEGPRLLLIKKSANIEELIMEVKRSEQITLNLNESTTTVEYILMVHNLSCVQIY